MERIAPSARLEAQIEELLHSELATSAEKLAELGRLGARLVLQRAVEDEVTAFLGRARYQRTPEAAGSRNGTRPKTVQTTEGELSVDMPQIRGAAERFISRVFPDSRTVIRTRPLEALIIGGYVRGLSDRDIEGLLEEAGLGQVSKSTASRICRELRARYKAFCARSLAEVELLALFLDAVYLPTRPSGAKAGVLVAGGYTTQAGACWWRSASASANRGRIGWTWAVTWRGAACARPGWWSATVRRVWQGDRGAVAAGRPPAVHGASKP